MLDIKTLLADLDARIHQFHDHSAKWLLEYTENLFHRRSADEQLMLADIVAETHLYLGLSDEEEQLMQSMAEHYLERGIVQGRQEGKQEGEKRGTIESILALLNMRFETDAVAALRPALETIDDLQILREGLLEVPESENLEAFRRTLSR